MDFIIEQVFFLFICNSSPTCRGRRILAIYCVKNCNTVSMIMPLSVTTRIPIFYQEKNHRHDRLYHHLQAALLIKLQLQ